MTTDRTVNLSTLDDTRGADFRGGAMTTTPRLRRLYYGTYQIVAGAAAGTVIRRSTNPQALPCFRWGAIAGAFAGHSDFTLRGLARRADEIGGR